MTQAVRPMHKKSTNGRSFYWYLAPLRGLFRLLCVVTPSLAARVALRLFRTPMRHATPPRERAWMADAEAFQFDVGRERLTAWTWGRGPIVLLVHGWEGRGSQMGAFVRPLVEAGFRVITLDGPGHGTASGRRSSVPQFAEAIAVLAERVAPVHGIITHSFGSAATGWAALHVPLADRFVFVAPPADLDHYVTFFADLIGLSGRVRREMISLLERRFDLRWDDVRYATMTPVEETELLVVQDRDDRESPMENGLAVSRSWPGSRLHWTSGLGHRRILRHPAVVAEVVRFMTAVPVAESAQPRAAPVVHDLGSTAAAPPASGSGDAGPPSIDSAIPMRTSACRKNTLPRHSDYWEWVQRAMVARKVPPKRGVSHVDLRCLHLDVERLDGT